MSNLKNKRSKLWNHFQIVGESKAKCGHCNKIISFRGGATGNLSRHMKSMHKAISIEMATYRHQTEDEEEMEDRVVSWKKKKVLTHSQAVITSFACRPLSVNKSKQLDEQLIRVIVKEFQPFRVVEDPEFKKFIQMLNPNYNIPDRATISNSLIPQIYNNIKDVVLKKLSETDAVCLTTDGWTSINNQSFISITVHFIDDDNGKQIFKSYLLDCIPLDERHTAKNVSDQLKIQADEWGLSNKIAGVISDNASDITEAIKATSWTLFPCFAHNLNLVLQAGIMEIQGQVNKVKAIVQFFKKNSSALAKLRSMQTQMGLPELKLKEDVVARWNSTYDMLSRILLVKPAVVGLLAVDEPHLNTLSPSDWNILEKSVEVLNLFYQVTEEISAETTVTISKVILFVNSMNNHLQNCINLQNPPEVNNLLEKLQAQINRRFEDFESNELTSEATFLDPRFKKYGFSSDDQYENTLKSIKEKISYSDVTANTPHQPPLLVEPNLYPETESKTSIWYEFDRAVKNFLALRKPKAASIVEVERYINEPLIRRTEDPLYWWEERKEIYPRLYKLMRRRLCVVATSVPGQRIFSKAGQLISEKRRRLKHEQASQVLFLNHNL
ncbi:E3 SUMO-protein ligase ZBED1-like [Diabrotica undecimpunctata]|uniref:E3 SUMO-protein ligase ZBED1-like n=1 Tax=Diabrotica undecimpunctata TaxID=50387 RepID=UPI003B63C87A